MNSRNDTFNCFSVKEPPASIGQITILAETFDGAKAWFDGEYDGTWRAKKVPANRPFYVRGWRIPDDSGGDVDSRTLNDPLHAERHPRLYPLS